MFKVRPRPASALLALSLSLSAAVATRAQDTTPKTGDTNKVEAQKTGQQDAQASGAQQQQQSKSQPVPLTSGEKIEHSFRAAFLRPTPYLSSIFSAGITQMREDRLPHKDSGDEAADWGSRAARTFATRTTATLFASGFYPALFKQDPRYEPSQNKHFGRRTLHAVSRVFVTRDDAGNLEPNYSRFAGVMTASALANVWEHSTPGHDRVGTDATLRRFASLLATNALGNIIFKEFGPDIMRIFRH
ncbi:MAG: hypothetical protein QOJ70_313 [Acidobacteriota bacterium]|jgi:hypothetical protein|nr:hypothetical protein [Acidobacteriota bacterium]